MKSSFFLFFCLSFLIVAFGQPSWFAPLAPVAAVCGYALLWRGLSQIPGKFWRFCIAAFWFTLVQLVQLSWMTAIEFQGIYMLIAYFWLASWLGVQFGLLSLLIPTVGQMRFARIIAIASLWTLLEWSRFYFLSGFSWNPSGIALTSSIFSIQLASLGGVLGLSLWVMLVNGLSFNLLTEILERRITWARSALVLGFAAFPYLFGLLHIAYHDREFAKVPEEKKLNVALVQTGLLPPQKLILPERVHTFVSPWEQWRRILVHLKETHAPTLDLIIFPEVALPFQSDKAIYAYETAVQILEQELGEEVRKALPPLHPPYAQKRWISDEEVWMVTNSFWTQALANYFHAEVVIGFEDEELATRNNYNAAFHFLPKKSFVNRYEKQVLLPVAEYLPMGWLLPLVEKYGMVDFFTKGRGTKVFEGVVPLAVSICYEETFPDLIREGKLQGAELLVNVTNDNWYPSSRLPQQHFDHGRLRAVENGVPLLRACNTGVSAAIDSLGRPLCIMEELDANSQWKAGALFAKLPLYHYKTLYTYWGDGGLVGLAFILLGCFLRLKKA